MHITRLLTLSALGILLLASLGAAEEPQKPAAKPDNFGILDTVYAEVSRIDPQNWSMTISATNDENVEGLAVPLKLSSGTVRIVADSAVYTGGRVDHFAYRGFRPDTMQQCVTLGMVANMGPSTNVLAPGKGRLVTVFVSSIEDQPVENLVVDTTTTSPSNSLMLVAQFEEIKNRLGEEAIRADKRLEIYPAFVVVKSK
ncbi:MAG TPA: hypothetical protein PK112_06105 [candidate division Zixibacteria bacterium]|nr:hypothetical protein [candidate division Zixibacteria bacterium]